jgi:CRP-like cAMP-binding protein
MEMFIIKSGIVEVLDFQDEEEIVYATLSHGPYACIAHRQAHSRAGQYFGELALLALANVGSRRTAFVRSVGYTEVFVMHKDDMQLILESDEVCAVHPPVACVLTCPRPCGTIC